MNNLLKAAARKHALANKIPTAGWTDQQFADYVAEHGITERDNLKKAHTENGASNAHLDPKPVAEPSGSVDEAIKHLVETLKPQAELDEDRVVELIKQHGKVETKVTHAINVTRKDGVQVSRDMVHKDYADILLMIGAGENVAAVGPAGSGKSTIFEHAAEDLGVQYYFQGAVQQEHKVMGYMDANGVYHGTQFREAYENGGLFVFEEFDGSSAKALLAINNAVAGSWCDFPDGKVKKHEDFVCVMAGNTYGTGASREYVGRQQLDAATLDRFAFVEIGYDEVLETKIAEGMSPENGAAWAATVQDFRKKVANAGLRHVVSPRATFGGIKLLNAGMDVNRVKQVRLHKGLSADQLAQVS